MQMATEWFEVGSLEASQGSPMDTRPFDESNLEAKADASVKSGDDAKLAEVSAEDDKAHCLAHVDHRTPKADRGKCVECATYT
jgi:hypothetical protein